MATNPTLLTMPIAENGQKNIIPATQAAAGDGLLSQSTGFPPETALPLGAGGKAPTREDFNGAFNLLSDIAFYSQKGWTFQYDENQAYYKGCIVMDATDGLRYECINDVAAGTILPSADQDNDYWREYSPGGVPLGSILAYGADAAEPPYGFLFCEGQAISRTMYPDLFDLIGTTYGAGDGSTTFNLPNLLGKYPQGDTTAGTVKAAGLPNITGDISPYTVSTATGGGSNTGTRNGSGALSSRSNNSVNYFSTAGTTTNAIDTGISFDASASNAIYGNSDTVTPPTLTVRWIIKAYDAPTPSSAQIDLSQYASDLANRLTREQTPAFNKRDVITTSGTYTAPVTGWYRIVVKGGGGGGKGGAYSSSAARGGLGGGEGGTTIGYEHLTAGDTVSVVVGAGGAGGVLVTNSLNYLAGTDGGDSTVTVGNITYTGGGGKTSGAGGAGTIPGAPGGVGYYSATANVSASGGHGGGAGGGYHASTAISGQLGGGGSGGSAQASNSSGSNDGAGGDGFVWFEYFDPTLN